MLVIEPADPPYAGGVLTWITRMSALAPGAALLSRVQAVAAHVTLRKPPPMRLPNAWMELDTAATDGGSSTVRFDPRDWPSAADPEARQPDDVLFVLLQAAERWFAVKAPPNAPVTVEMLSALKAYRALRPRSV